MLGHVPGRQDIGVRGGQAVVDHHAVLDLQPACFASELLARMPVAMTTRSAGIVLAVLQEDTLDPFVSEDLPRHRLVAERDPDPADMIAQDLLLPVRSTVAARATRGLPTSVTLAPRRASAPAVSRPRIPPPMQTQRAPAAHALSR